ncbi:MAG: hypothetical protein U9Q81_14845 [Pseudomonadota bacterium]|nr:hypothetical protein [Pseudomonadota bacterium]
MYRLRFVGFLLMFLLILGGGPASGSGGHDKDVSAGASLTGTATESKIRFDPDRLDANGLQGAPDGLRALHYEYCIPDRADAIREVSAIDPTLQIQRGSPGRVGCREGKLLCLGHTHQADHRAVLDRLAALDAVAEIREAFFE